MLAVCVLCCVLVAVCRAARVISTDSSPPWPAARPAGGRGDACVKWTDKWAERLLPGGGRQQWGDKWREEFASGQGAKEGEVRGWLAGCLLWLAACVLWRFRLTGRPATMACCLPAGAAASVAVGYACRGCSDYDAGQCLTLRSLALLLTASCVAVAFCRCGVRRQAESATSAGGVRTTWAMARWGLLCLWRPAQWRCCCCACIGCLAWPVLAVCMGVRLSAAAVVIASSRAEAELRSCNLPCMEHTAAAAMHPFFPGTQPLLTHARRCLALQVRKSGNSTSGENWDFIEHMDTYYNPIPHYGFQLALQHSPQLRGVPMLDKDRAARQQREQSGGGGGDGGDDDVFGPGIDSL